MPSKLGYVMFLVFGMVDGFYKVKRGLVRALRVYFSSTFLFFFIFFCWLNLL